MFAEITTRLTMSQRKEIVKPRKSSRNLGNSFFCAAKFKNIETDAGIKKLILSRKPKCERKFKLAQNGN